MRLKIFWSRPSFRDVASAAGHDIGTRNAIENFWSRLSFGHVASAASHNIGARNAIENFLNYLKSTKLWRCCECRLSRYWREKCDWKFFEVDQALEMLRVPLVTILAREMRLKIFWIFWSRPSFGDGDSAARREKCDWKFLKSTKLWTCCECR